MVPLISKQSEILSIERIKKKVPIKKTHTNHTNVSIIAQNQTKQNLIKHWNHSERIKKVRSKKLRAFILLSLFHTFVECSSF